MALFLIVHTEVYFGWMSSKTQRIADRGLWSSNTDLNVPHHVFTIQLSIDVVTINKML